MIISHKHKFIFIHGPKTAGTTMADALAPFCGEDDIIIQHRSPEGIKKHDPSRVIFDLVGQEVWDRYYKFTFERNPWDKMVSLWAMQVDPEHWKRTDVSFMSRIKHHFRAKKMEKNPPSFKQWLLKKHKSKLHSGLPKYLGDLYHIDGPLKVDYIGKFEQLNKDFKNVTDHLGLDVNLPEGKREQRKKADPTFVPDLNSYRKHYDDELQKIVAEAYTKEIEHLGYTF